MRWHNPCIKTMLNYGRRVLHRTFSTAPGTHGLGNKQVPVALGTLLRLRMVLPQGGLAEWPAWGPRISRFNCLGEVAERPHRTLPMISVDRFVGRLSVLQVYQAALNMFQCCRSERQLGPLSRSWAPRSGAFDAIGG